MKILIGSLLFATAIFINFPELNSSPRPTGAGSYQRNVIVRPYEPKERGPPTYMTEILVLNKNIEVYLRKNKKDEYVAVECNVYHCPSKIPTTTNKGKYNFMTQPFFKDYYGSKIKIVIYVKVDKDNTKTLIGAKVPPKEHEVHTPGDPHGLDPDESKYFFTYKGIDYVVEYDGKTETCTDVQLWGHPNIRPNPAVINRNWHTYHYFRFNDIYVLVFLNYNKAIEGAALDPFWTYRPNERDAHLNLHAEYQQLHKLQIKKYHPLAENTAPRENVHQNQIIAPQHDRQYQQNLNRHENLYTNQILDENHNQHYAQQSAYPPPYFDSSQYHGQSSGTSPPHFDPNANWNHPPHYPPNP